MFYDPDGSGLAEAELFCILRGKVFLTASDIALTL